MKLYALFYYDRPLLKAWLNHYVHFDCIDEIIIQNQNWSPQDTMYLLKTVADYVDEHHKKIVVLPSNFKHFKNQNKRSQFLMYGQSVIRNRVTQFLQDTTFIASSMDEVIYEKNYEYTEEQLQKFENRAEDRAERGLSTVGFIPLYCAWPDVIYPCNGIPIRRLELPQWRHRLFRFVAPFRRRKSLIHDTTYQVFTTRKGKEKWFDETPSSYLLSREEVENRREALALDLKLIHYHTLVHPKFDSAEYMIPSLNNIQNLEEHPKFYIEKFKSSSTGKSPKKPEPKSPKTSWSKPKKSEGEQVKPSRRPEKQLKQKRKTTRIYPKWKSTKPPVKLPKHRSTKKLKQPRVKNPKKHRLTEYWRQVAINNRNLLYDWHHGIPYDWWHGLTMDEFLKELPQHLDKRHEPLWFSDAK